jgi:DNA-binding transcriptional regulator LsrR (DeoR family)
MSNITRYKVNQLLSKLEEEGYVKLESQRQKYIK